MIKIKKIRKYTGLAVLIVVLSLLISNIWVFLMGRSNICQAIDDVEPRSVCLVLGTSKSLRNGSANPFFVNRIDAAYELYKSGKVKHFILSGDNREKYYNEPMDMKRALTAKGVPDSVITLDYAGLSTLDSVVRAKLIFGQSDILVVTQKFHSFRAAFLCQSFGIKAQVFLARSIPVRNSVRVHLREFFARFRAIIDVYLVHRTPKHLGEKIDITMN